MTKPSGAGREIDREAGRLALATLIRGLSVGFGFVALLGLAIGNAPIVPPLCAVASIVCLVVAHKVAKEKPWL